MMAACAIKRSNAIIIFRRSIVVGNRGSFWNHSECFHIHGIPINKGIRFTAVVNIKWRKDKRFFVYLYAAWVFFVSLLVS